MILITLGVLADSSTTPPGSPPVDLQRTLGVQQPSTAAIAAAPAPDTSSILAALANMARQQNTAAPLTAPAPPQNQDSSYSFPNAQNNLPSLPFPPMPPPVNMPTFASQSQGANGGAQNFASNQSTPFAAIPPIAPPAGLDPAVQQQLILIKTLRDAGVAPDQIAGVIAHLGNQAGAAPGLLPPQFPAQSQNQIQNQSVPNGQNAWGARPEESRDRNGYPEGARSPPSRYRRRSRSPSPPRGWNAHDSPATRRRDDQNHDYGRDSPGRNRGGRGGRANDYRQRSPPPRRTRSPTPPQAHGGGEKWIGHDASIAKGNIKGNRRRSLCLKSLF
jgi:protein NRD1